MVNVMHYKGYTGSIAFSKEDTIFHGKIDAIDDLITFEGASDDEIRKAFQEAVDDYLESCKALGREPQKASIIEAG